MPKKIVLINYDKCHPEHCDTGICKAVLVCHYKLLKQEMPYEAPMPYQSLCQGCGKCVMVCPLKAIQLN
ncbi:MAG: 4Fe-4S binding protein [Actinobacteria bacterium]|nr:4Fe-4S binding protein [Actinomycetota bacterium]